MTAGRGPVRAGAASALALLLVALSVLCGCSAGSARQVVHVLGPWTGAAEETFRAVVAPFERQTGITVEYQGSAESDSVLADRVAGGAPPELAVFDSPRKVATYARAGRLTALDGLLAASDGGSDYGPGWAELGAVDGTPYAVPVTATVKSLVWYSPRSLDDQGRQPPRDWARLTALSGEAAAAGIAPWCVGLADGSASGRPGTDWLEDIVLTQSGLEVYDGWASGRIAWASPQIRLAWQTWGATIAEDRLRGGRRGALNGRFGDNGAFLLAHNPQCLLEHADSAAIGNYRQYNPPPKPGQDIDFTRFPAVDPRYDGDLEVAGDLVAMVHGTPGARRLLTFLTSADAQSRWVAGGTVLSPDRAVPPAAYPDELSRRLARTLLEARAVRFDASDQMPQELQDAFYRAVLTFVDDPSRLDELLAGLDRIAASLGR
ncbi:ABC transporter substrate-binding protein [Kitasatospora sp. NPDC094015]|uniref:ABC transporter substrate-binding protein n=1 Tax=Kitasatospora sp. NPDC094015 TaxID=3155205 RepID=UPI003320CBD9